MTCHCASPAEHQARADQAAARHQHAIQQNAAKRVAELEREIASMTADPSKYEILNVALVSGRLILKVRFPSCTKCAYEGIKVLVYENVSPIDAMKWKRLDPHFRAEKPKSPQDAPSPIARFHGTDAGWQLAKDFSSK